MFFHRLDGDAASKEVSSPSGHFPYGWVVLTSCLIFAAALFGIRYSFGVFFKSLEAEFDWSRATTSALFSVYMLVASAFAIIEGWLLDKYGPRVVAFGMGLVSGLSLLLSGLAQSAWQLYFTYSLLLALGTGGTYNLVMSTGSRWFSQRRATALGIIGAGAGLGTMTLSPFTAWLISAYSWRTAFLTLAVVACAFVLPAALLLKRDPEEIQAKPDGQQASVRGRQTDSAEDFSLAQALRSHSFWLIFFTWLAYSFCLHLVMTHVVPRAKDVGIASVQAATILSLLSGLSAPSRIVVGYVADRLGRKITAIVMALLHVVAMLWLMGCTELWMFYLFAIVYGLAYGGIDPPIVASIGEIFGLQSVGTIMGALVVGWGLGAAMGPYLGGLIFDLSGSYQFAFLSGALIMLLAGVFIYRLRIPETSRGTR